MRPTAFGPPRASRRQFLTQAAAATGVTLSARIATAEGDENPAGVPWYRRSFRWWQTTLTEADPARYDLAWWRSYWKETEIQGVIVNAGGIYAYYPSRFPLHHRAATLGDRDLYGEITRAAHEDGLAVLARMDS